MCKNWTGKSRFRIEESIRFHQEYFSACHWGCNFAHAKFQLNPLDMEKVQASSRFARMHPCQVSDDEIS